jgi:predicted PurR-regulated permease PerM
LWTLPVKSTFSSTSWQRTFFVLGSIVLVILSLYWAQKIFIPLALAVLLSFILHPVVFGLQRIGLRKLPAVIVVLCLALSLLVVLGWILTVQAKSLAIEWHDYRDNIDQKIGQLGIGQFQDGESFLLDRIKNLAQQMIDNILKAVIAPVFETLLEAFFVIVLLAFILLKREDLRNRLIRLVGQGQRTVATTKALDEATHRISRYLFVQVLINAGFGLALCLGLSLIGLDYSILWGSLAALMRFIPYVGTWVAAILPTMFSLATSQPPGEWIQPLEVFGFFLVLELLTAYVLEPFLFGLSVGVSPVALLVAAVFWMWLWGPWGLLLSTPLTVCLLVLGRYVPQLEFFEILLGNDPSLEAGVSFYQRLLAKDQDEAADLFEEQIRGRSLESICDEVVIPTMALAKRDRQRGVLSGKDEHFILQTIGNLVADLAPPAPAKSELSLRSNLMILGLAASNKFDELALKIVQQMLSSDGCSLMIVSAKVLSSEVISLIEKAKPALVLIATLAPEGITQTRYHCKRLRAKFPDLKILVSRWGHQENGGNQPDRILAAGANHLATTLAETRCQIITFLQVEAYSQKTKELLPSS